MSELGVAERCYKRELETLEDFVRSLNSLAFEEWHGHYQGEHFDIFDSEDNCVASGADAYEAFVEMEKMK